jgi:hypothetical protein
VRPQRWARPRQLKPPGFVVPAKPVLSLKVPVGDGWLHELKHDGFRIVAPCDDGGPSQKIGALEQDRPSPFRVGSRPGDAPPEAHR